MLIKTDSKIELLFNLYKRHVRLESIKGKINSSRILCELYAKFCVILIFHGIVSCIKLKPDREISLTKALIELKKRSKELFVIVNNRLDDLQYFFKNYS